MNHDVACQPLVHEESSMNLSHTDGDGHALALEGQRRGHRLIQIFGTVPWNGMTAYCSTADTWMGDSGGPVWRAAPGGGVYALGETVAAYTSGPHVGDGCFLPIADVAAKWGTTCLPVWTPTTCQNLAATSAMAATAASTRLPVLSTEHLVPAVQHAAY